MTARKGYSKHPPIQLLPDGRKQIVRRTPVMFPSTGVALIDTELFVAWGTADAEFTSLHLVGQEINAADNLTEGDKSELVQTFAEIATTGETAVGGYRISQDGSGRHSLVSSAIQFAATTLVEGTPGATTLTVGGIAYVLDTVNSDSNGAVRTITRNWIQATTTPTQIGTWSVRIADPDAFKIALGVYTPVREFVGQFLVAGDGSLATYWLGLNTSATIGGATAYLTEEEITHRGISHAIITRVYTELPDTFTYTREIDFPFPGEFSSGKTPTVGKTEETITEAYSLGIPTRATLGYNLKRYATISITATVDGDATSQTITDYKPGYLSGGFGVSATNQTIDGIKYSSYIATSSSDPTNYPAAGAQIISSQPQRWRGMIWRLTNRSVVF